MAAHGEELEDESVDEGTSSDCAPSATTPFFRRAKSKVPDVADTSLLDRATGLVNRQRREYAEITRGYGVYDWLAFFIPCLRWLKGYNVRSWLMWDILAGLSVGAMVIPQGMSYANLAGLPQVYGLYGTAVPCLVYALLGSSRQLAVGPVAITSTLLGSGLDSLFNTGGISPCLAPPDGFPSPPPPVDKAAPYATCDQFQQAAIQVAFLAGVLYTAVGLLNLGFLTYFLSHATISGFMSGAAILIALSQVKYILGLSIAKRADRLVEQLQLIFDAMGTFSWQEFAMGMAFILILFTCRTVSRRVEKLFFLRALGPITVCILSIALMNIFKWYEAPPGGKPPIKSVGVIPKGLPNVTVSWWFPLFDVGKQILLSIVIALIDMCESMSISKALANKNKYRLNATQELRGLGLANLAGAMFNAYTTTGSFSRSAVNDSVGAKTPLAGFITGVLVMITLVALTPVFKNMSSNVQGAIIIVGVLGLFQHDDFIQLWRVSRLDWMIWVITFLFTLFLGVEIGLLAGVVVSLVLVLYKTAFPRIASLGRLPGTRVYRNKDMYADVIEPPGMILVRIDAPIYFANVEGIKDFLLDKLEKGQQEHQQLGDPVRFVIIDLSPSPNIDIAGVHFFEDLVAELTRDNIQLILANPSRDVMLKLNRAKLLQKMGDAGVAVSMGEAVAYAETRLMEEASAASSANL